MGLPSFTLHLCLGNWIVFPNKRLNPALGFCAHYRGDLAEEEVAAKEATKHNDITEMKVDADSCLSPPLQRAERRPQRDL